MARTKTTERVGETFVSSEGCLFFIKEYNSNKDLIIKFMDEYGAEVHTAYCNCKRGNVKNPYFKSSFGIGYMGLFSDGSRPIVKVNGKHTREYTLWYQMLNRCYSGTYPSYENATVCERWLCFANFVEDLPKIENYQYWLDNPNQQIALDKDLKQKGVTNKVYSLDTCKFVSKSENSKEVCERSAKKVIGKSLTGNKVIILKNVKQAELLGFNINTIYACCNESHRLKSHGGYTWSYIK